MRLQLGVRSSRYRRQSERNVLRGTERGVKTQLFTRKDIMYMLHVYTHILHMQRVRYGQRRGRDDVFY